MASSRSCRFCSISMDDRRQLPPGITGRGENMKFSDIHVGSIYNVIFDPVRDCEFNGKHLALVLKRNNDKKTFVVLPLTSRSNGAGINKISLGTIPSLPRSLRKNHTYAVFNQIRTVNASRFIALKEGGNVVEVKLEEGVFYGLFQYVIEDMLHNCEQESKIALLKSLYQKECIIKAKDLAYDIIKINEETAAEKEEIQKKEMEIREIVKDIPYRLHEKFIEDGVEEVFKEAILRKTEH